MSKFLFILLDENIYKKDVSLSPSIETETAVSFDVPAQAETLTIKGSKVKKIYLII